MKGAAIKKPRTKPAEERREELMDVAQALFLEKGFAATSVSEIVAGADVAKGTFYTYFQTKDDVLSALQERFVEGFCATIDAALASGPESWARKLSCFASTCVNIYLDEIDLHDLVFHQVLSTNRQLTTQNPVIVRLSALLRSGHEDGAWMCDQPGLTSVMLFNALHGAIDHVVRAQKPVQRTELIGAVTMFWRDALCLGAE